MFPYYGSKRQLTLSGFYPFPEYGVCIEPFGGSAGFSTTHLRWFSKVVLLERDPHVVQLWRRLLASTPDELRATRIPEIGERTTDRLWMNFATSNGTATSESMLVTKRMAGLMPAKLRRMCAELPAIKKKVEIIEGGYEDAPDLLGVWFLDPPYHGESGMGYAKGCNSASIDYGALADFAKSRRGQTIVCESVAADWLPFQPLLPHLQSRRFPDEVVWVGGDTHRRQRMAVGLIAEALPPVRRMS